MNDLGGSLSGLIYSSGIIFRTSRGHFPDGRIQVTFRNSCWHVSSQKRIPNNILNETFDTVKQLILPFKPLCFPLASLFPIRVQLLLSLQQSARVNNIYLFFIFKYVAILKKRLKDEKKTKERKK